MPEPGGLTLAEVEDLAARRRGTRRVAGLGLTGHSAPDVATPSARRRALVAAAGCNSERDSRV